MPGWLAVPWSAVPAPGMVWLPWPVVPRAGLPWLELLVSEDGKVPAVALGVCPEVVLAVEVSPEALAPVCPPAWLEAGVFWPRPVLAPELPLELDVVAPVELGIPWSEVAWLSPPFRPLWQPAKMSSEAMINAYLVILSLV